MRKFLRILSLCLIAVLSCTISPASATHDKPQVRLVRPIPGRAVTPFVVGYANWVSGHRGVDLAGFQGQPVRAAAGGTVRYSGWLVDRGVVSIDHGGWWTTYEPLRPTMRRGATVARGDVIGYLSNGHCETACLHWGFTNGSGYLNPFDFVRPLEVRLLPTRNIQARG